MTVRDLVDIVLLWDLVPPEDRSAVREACEQIFELRRLHPWPPRVQPPDRWAGPFRALATDIRFPLDDVATAGNAVAAIVDELRRRPGSGQ